MSDTIHWVLPHVLRLRCLGIDTYQEPVIYMHSDCHVCRAEGFESQSHVQVTHNDVALIATLNVATGEFLAPDDVGLSEAAWWLLGAHEGDAVMLSHPPILESLGLLRDKVHDKMNSEQQKQRMPVLIKCLQSAMRPRS